MQADKNYRNKKFCERGESEINLLTGEHVGEKTNGEGERPGEVADQFDGEHQKRQPPERTQKLLDITAAVSPNAGVVIEEKSRNRQTERNHGIHGGRIEARDQPDQVHEQYEKEDGAKKSEVAGPVMADDFFGRGMDELIGEFHSVLEFAGTVNGKPAAKNRKKNQNEANNEDFADQPIAPWISLVLRRKIYRIQKRIRGPGQMGVEDFGDPKFVHLFGSTASA